MTQAALRDRLDDLRRAREAGDVDAERRLRLELVEARLAERIESENVTALLGDVALLILCADDAQEENEHAAAIALYAAARLFAERLKEDLWARRAALHAASSCVALLDFDSAAELITASLQVDDASPGNVAAAKAIKRLIDGQAGRPLRDLRAECLYAVARYYAAVGALQDADRVLSALLDLHSRPKAGGPGSSEAWFSAPDLALFAAEVRLDRGDFVGFRNLQQRWLDDATPERIRGAWLLLEASALHLESRLS